MADRVHFTGYLDDSDLSALYSGAVAFLYPSLYEGFGLPALEAMACDCPVLCSDAASIPEVAGDVALLADPTDPEAWAEGIGRLVYEETLRSCLVEKGRPRDEMFSWQEAASRTLRLFRGLS